MLDYCYSFCSILLKRNSRNIVKEIFLGIIASLILMAVYQTAGMVWGNLLVLFYCFMIHITCMVENETFFSYQDLEILNFKGNNVHFKVIYLLQRILLDMFVANFIVIVSVFTYLLIAADVTNALFFLTIIIMSQCLMPSYNYWAYKVGEQGVIASVMFLILILVLLVVGCVHGMDPLRWLFNGSSYLSSLLFVLFTAVYILALDFLSHHYKKRPGAIFHTRFFFAWIKPINVFVFKDYVLFYKHVLFNLVMIITLYSLLIMGTEERLLPFMTAFIIGSNSIFAVKRKKQYTLISEDSLFDESIIKMDIKTIRITKLKTILSGAMIKIILCFGMLFYHGFHEWMIFSSLTVIMIIGSVIEFIVVYRNRLSSTIMNKVLIYTAIVIFGITSYFDTQYMLLWTYLIVLSLYCLSFTVGILNKGLLQTTTKKDYYFAKT
jgi:hypothetical protein